MGERGSLNSKSIDLLLEGVGDDDTVFVKWSKKLKAATEVKVVMIWRIALSLTVSDSLCGNIMGGQGVK